MAVAEQELRNTPGAPPEGGADFNIDHYLTAERGKDLLRFSTAGSVDDGKSTLIGRLLYDSQSVYDDQIQSIEGKGTTAPGVLDLALLTDGLRAEREQGITIDVAYRYFSTARRKFIIADTPGHEQYTRNMATGASTANAAIVLIDARKGVLPQSRRHAYITALLGVKQIILAVNKMDLVEYSEESFERICSEFRSYFSQLPVDGVDAIQLYFVPVSALAGDNVVHSSEKMPWYRGLPLLALLETIPGATENQTEPFRMPVQRVVRPHQDFRGFAGQLASGTVRPGDLVTVLPSGQSSRVERIVTFDGDLTEASAPLSVTLTLEDEIDISRGDLLVASAHPAQVATQLRASLVWMDAVPLQLGHRYLLKIASRTVQAEVRAIKHVADLTGEGTGSADTVTSLGLNGIAEVEIAALQPVAFDPYVKNRNTGSFILIDLKTNATVAAGMLRAAGKQGAATYPLHPVTAADRIARYGHAGAQLVVTGPVAFADILEQALVARGSLLLRIPAEELPSVPVQLLVKQGALVLTHSASAPEAEPALRAGELTFTTPGSEPEDWVAGILLALEQAKVLRPKGEHP